MNFVSLGLFSIGLLTGVINGRSVEKDIKQSTALEENKQGGTFGLAPYTLGVLGPAIIQLLVHRPESVAWFIGHEIGLHASIFINSRKYIES